MRRLVALALCATSAAAAVAHSLDNFVRPGVHHASFFDVDASVSAQTSAEGLDVIWANHLDETAMDVRETPDGLRLEPFPRDLGARRGAALPVSGVAEPKHLKKMTSPFPCRILSLRNLLLHST